MTSPLTYVYCLVADARRPSVAASGRRPKGLPGAGRIRLLQVPGERLWAVVADAPAAQFDERAINKGLTDLEWVSRAAVAHEAVVESFIKSTAVLPMKLFTLFKSDARTLEHIARQRPTIAAAIKRVARHDEWGVRVLLDRARATSAARDRATEAGVSSGAGYLQRKKAQRDATAELARRAREVVADLYDLLSSHATLARRRAAREGPADGGPLLLDAAFLVPRTRTRRFRGIVAGEAKRIVPQGYRIVLSGPWPPYTFMQD